MGSGLEHGQAVARVHHRAQETLELGRIGRRRAVLVRPAPPADADLDRPDESRRQSRGSEHAGHQERARRLPVRPGHPDDAEVAGGPTLPPRGRDRERELGPFDDELWHIDPADRPFDEERRRPRGDGGRGELVAVVMETRHGDEDRPGSDSPRVVGHAADGEGCDVGKRGRSSLRHK